eukprot:COSAG05_NODE_19720_length_288_cov_1.640212_1_plen_49_part_01
MNHGGWSHARARVLRDSDFRQMHDMFGIIILIKKEGLKKVTSAVDSIII